MVVIFFLIAHYRISYLVYRKGVTDCEQFMGVEWTHSMDAQFGILFQYCGLYAG